VAGLAAGAVRGYVRWAPGRLGKRAIVERLVEPRLARRAHPFRARTIHGAVLDGDHRWIMPRCLYWFGVWEPALSRWIEERLAPGDVFVDVGANMGYYALLAASRVGPGGGVVALEPAPATLAKLRANLALNPFARVRTVPAAAGARRGPVPFYRAPWNDAESSTVSAPRFEPDGEVEAYPLAELLTAGELARTRVIKIDVEGGEWNVVEGLEPDIDRFPDGVEIVIEVHPDLLEGRSAAALAARLAPHGFEPSWLPVDFGAAAHVERRPRVVPVPGLPPPDRLVHLILSRQRRAPAARPASSAA
jgi:FkbM family methyltransferase